MVDFGRHCHNWWACIIVTLATHEVHHNPMLFSLFVQAITASAEFIAQCRHGAAVAFAISQGPWLITSVALYLLLGLTGIVAITSVFCRSFIAVTSPEFTDFLAIASLSLQSSSWSHLRDCEVNCDCLHDSWSSLYLLFANSWNNCKCFYNSQGSPKLLLWAHNNVVVAVMSCKYAALLSSQIHKSFATICVAHGKCLTIACPTSWDHHDQQLLGENALRLLSWITGSREWLLSWTELACLQGQVARPWRAFKVILRNQILRTLGLKLVGFLGVSRG